MERLTEKYIENNVPKYDLAPTNFSDDLSTHNAQCEVAINRVIDKLGQLEDVEELCEKIVSQPIYEKFRDTGEIHKEKYTDYIALYNFKERRIEIYGFEFIMWFKLDEYGKFWAFTKEELE